MHFVAQHSLDARISEQKHVVTSCINTRTVHVVLAVLVVTRFLKSKSLHRTSGSIDNDFFVERKTRHDILHPPYELKFVIIQLLNMANSGGAESVVSVVLKQERTDHF